MKKFLLSLGLVIACGVVSAQVAATFPDPAEDTHDYGTVTYGDDIVKLENNWIYAAADGFSNFPSLADRTRSMAYANGKVYLLEKMIAQKPDTDIFEGKIFLHVFDAESGKLNKTVDISDRIFRKADNPNSFINQFAAIPLTTDSEGHLVIGNLATNFQVGSLVVYVMKDEDDENPLKVLDFSHDMGITDYTLRADHIGAYGDLTTGEGYIFAACSSTNYVVRWKIVDGTFTLEGEDPIEFVTPDLPSNPKAVKIQPEVMLPTGTAHFNFGAFVYPVSEGLFVTDGHATIPAMYDMNGSIRDGFATITVQGNQTLIEQFDSSKRPSTGANGYDEVSLGEQDFVIVGKNNHGGDVNTDKNTFMIFRKHEAGGDISKGVDVAYNQFPINGLGARSNASHVTIPRVHKVSENVAEIYVFAYDNGLAKYTLTVNDGISVIEDEADRLRVSVNGSVITATEVLASIEVYSVAGQKVASAVSTSTVDAPAAGIYVVKTVDKAGSALTHKVIVK